MIRVISDLSVNTLLERFLMHQERQQVAIRADDVSAANRHFLKVKEYADALARTPQGKDVLETLVGDFLPFVRLRAAHRVRAWAPEIAIPVLGRLLIEDLSAMSIDERLELRVSAKNSLYSFFDIRSFDQNDLIEPLRAYGVDLPYRDHKKWQ